MLRLDGPGDDAAVLRLMTREPWRTHAAGLLARESQVQELLAGASSVPAPRSLALDALAEEAEHPAHLMTLLPGQLELRRSDGNLLEALAQLLLSIHRVDPGQQRPRDFQSWAHEAKRVVPEWAGRASAWRRAFTLLAEEPPAYDACFLHRDFHLGNVLWRDGQVSGVVDWVETSWGPAALDVAHASTYLAMLSGPDSASEFVHRYRAAGGDVDPERDRHWFVMDAVGYLPDPRKVADPWRAGGVTLPAETVQDRLEQRLVDVLG
jgi:aminoglycoside phosphotransferase (APT) family kinase protein